MRSFAAALTCAMLTLPGMSSARSINDGLGTTSFTWLKTFSDAGISAAGETMAARDGAAGLLVHPAAIAGIEQPAVKMSYVQYYVDTQFGSVGYARQMGGKDIGIRMTYVNYGEFLGTDDAGNLTGSFTAGDLGISLNVGKKVRDDLKVGAIVSFLTSQIEDFSAQAATIDLGAIYTPPFDGLTVGAALMNAGAVLSGYSSDYDDKLPTFLTVGMRKALAHAPIALIADVTFPSDDDTAFGFGVEFTPNPRLSLFGGVHSRTNVDSDGGKAETDFGAITTFGVGLTMNRYRFNYAYCPNDNLEAAHKVTLNLLVP